jgi:hypothetical protein
MGKDKQTFIDVMLEFQKAKEEFINCVAKELYVFRFLDWLELKLKRIFK